MNVDDEKLIGDCAECGPDTPVKWKAHKKRYVCRIAHNAAEEARRARRRAENPAPPRLKRFDNQSDERRFYNYGLTPEAWESIKAEQGYRCGICNRKRVLVPDHCHKYGHVRGALCDTCNRGIGMLGDNLVGVLRAVKYLRKAKAAR